MGLARIKKGDMVMILSGRERGKTGKVLEILTKKERVLVERLNRVKRHLKPQQKSKQGGILEKEAPLALSVVMLLCPKCNKGVRTTTQLAKDGTKARVCVHCEGKLDGKK